MRIQKLILPLFALCSLGHATSALVGVYSGSSSPDSVSELALLDDGKFCFGFMGGDLDLLIGGTWSTNGKNIILKEHRQPKEAFLASAYHSPNAKDRAVVIDGHGLSNAVDTIFGTSKDGQPHEMKQVLEPDYNGFSSRYEIPIGSDLDESIFVGNLIGENHTRELIHEVFEFKLNQKDANRLWVTFNRDVMREPLDINGTFSKNSISMTSRDKFKKSSRKIDETFESNIRKRCIDPVFNPKSRESKGWINPIRVFQLNIKDMPTKYYFKRDEN